MKLSECHEVPDSIQTICGSIRQGRPLNLLVNLDPPQRYLAVFIQRFRNQLLLAGFSQEDNDLVNNALALAVEAHCNQGRITESTHIYHVVRIAWRLLQYGCRDPKVISAALLHDTVEDQLTFLVQQSKITPKNAFDVEPAFHFITEHFTERVSAMVSGMTKQDAYFMDAQEVEGYLHSITKKCADIDVAAIIISDTIDNLQDINQLDPRRQRWRVMKYLPVVNFLITFVEELNNEHFLKNTLYDLELARTALKKIAA